MVIYVVSQFHDPNGHDTHPKLNVHITSNIHTVGINLNGRLCFFQNATLLEIQNVCPTAAIYSTTVLYYVTTLYVCSPVAFTWREQCGFETDVAASEVWLISNQSVCTGMYSIFSSIQIYFFWHEIQSTYCEKQVEHIQVIRMTIKVVKI